MDIPVTSEQHDPITNTSLKPFPPLAVELVRCILENAALDDGPTALALAHVSKDVQRWITPIICHSVVLMGGDHMRSFFQVLETTWTNACESVRRLYIGIPGYSKNYGKAISDILFRRKTLKSLTTDVLILEDDSAVPNSTFPGPWHLEVKYPMDLIPDHHFMHDITHLSLGSLHRKRSNAIESLPHLTHLAVGCWGEDHPLNFVSDIMRLLSRPSIVMILICLGVSTEERYTDFLVGRTWCQLANIQNKRLVTWPGHCRDGKFALFHSGGTLWDVAKVRYWNWRQLVPSGPWEPLHLSTKFEGLK